MSVRATGSEEVVVNDFTDFTQTDPQITVLADGGWVVTYASEGTDGSGYAIFQQRFDAGGSAVGPEIQANTTAAGDQTSPAVVALADGGWVVCWNGPDSEATGVFQRRFGSDGEPFGPDELVNLLSEGEQGTPAITALADGGWIIAFSSNSIDPSMTGIHAVLFGPDGTNIGEQFVTLGLAGLHTDPSIAGLGDGGWVISWTVEENGELDVLQQRFAVGGTDLGPPVVVNTFRSNDQANSVVTALADGGWVVVWESGGQDGTLRTIYQQQFDAYGSPTGLETRVSPAAMGAEEHPQVTALADGGWIVSWEGNDLGGLGLYQQRFAADGQAIGIATVLNGTQSGTQSNATLAGLPDGSWIAAWVDNASGTNANILQRIFAPDLVGGSGSDTLVGTRWSESLIGNAGNDSLDGGGGDDLLIGGLGNDLYFVNFEFARIRELPNQGLDTVHASVTFALGTAAVERLTLTGTAAINGSGNALDNTILGNTAANVITGDLGNDTLNGNAGHDTLGGGSGNDVLNGGSGNDTLNGGSGRDTVSYAGANGGVSVSLALAGPQATGGPGTDTLVSIEDLIGSRHSDTLTGNGFDNVIEGDDGNDVMDGGGGIDTASYVGANTAIGSPSTGVTVSLALAGPQATLGAGNDTLSGFENLLGSTHGDTLTGDGADNVIDGFTGNDTLNGGGGIDTASYASSTAGVAVSLAVLTQQNTIGAGLDTLAGFENLLGSNFADTLIGDAVNNFLSGGTGNDLLRGNNGRDRLSGGRGIDTLSGGSGSDRYIFDDGDTGNSFNTADLIQGFSQAQGDSIDLSQVDTNALVGGDQAFTFIGDAAFSGAAGELRFEIGAGMTLILGDLNGDTFADFVIRLDAEVLLTGADFAL